ENRMVSDVINGVWDMRRETKSSSCGVSYGRGVGGVYYGDNGTISRDEYEGSDFSYSSSSKPHEFTPDSLDGKGKCTSCKSTFSMLTIHNPHEYKPRDIPTMAYKPCAICDWSLEQGKHSNKPHKFEAGKGKHGGISSKCEICGLFERANLHVAENPNPVFTIKRHLYKRYNVIDDRCGDCGMTKYSVLDTQYVHEIA